MIFDYSHGETMKIPRGWLSYVSPEIMRELKVSPSSQTCIQLPFSKQSDVYAFG